MKDRNTRYLQADWPRWAKCPKTKNTKRTQFNAQVISDIKSSTPEANPIPALAQRSQGSILWPGGPQKNDQSRRGQAILSPAGGLSPGALCRKRGGSPEPDVTRPK